VFRSTAEGETGHAHGHLEYLEAVGDPATGLPIGPTSHNLKAAIAGETHEYTDMYPGMSKTARTEGFAEIADWFETLAKAERSHANRFQKALVEQAKNRTKSRVRAKVEHVFGVIKNIFGFRKVRYRGLAKNLHRLEVTAALTNLYLVRRQLLRA
jgi:rubrerythrin